MARIHNFSAGPGVLPEPVLQQAQQDLWDVAGSGIGITECSHRSALFEGVIAETKARIARLMKLSDDQEILFLHGGARTQFYQWPLNILRGGRAAYLDTGTWSHGASTEAARYGDVDVLWSSRERGYNGVPAAGEWSAMAPGTVYLHYTSNNTVAGSEYHYMPDSGDALLACDMSSNFLSRPIDGSKFDFIYAGAQKNCGPSGVTVVIVKRELLDRMDTDIPSMLQYGIQVKKNSMLNTPCTYAIHVIGLVTKWLEELGGVEAIEKRNIAQSQAIYDQIDGTDFWQGKVERASRSRMNITFTCGNDELDTEFWKAGVGLGLSGLKGHRSVGGLRASLYNAQTDAAVAALVEYMATFENQKG